MKFITLKQLEELEWKDSVTEVVYNGESCEDGVSPWYTVYYADGTQEDIYIKPTDYNVIKEQIIKDITDEYTDYYKELGYEYWKDLLSDGNTEIDGGEYDKVLYNDFEEEQLEELWRNSHCNKLSK